MSEDGDSQRKSGQVKTEIRPQQLGLLPDRQHQTIQERFEEFCNEAISRLTTTDCGGDPIFAAGSAKSRFQVTVDVERTADDALSFSFSHTIKTNHPEVPGVAKSAMVVKGVGLAQRVSLDQPLLFDAEHGQPQPMSPEEANERLAAE